MQLDSRITEYKFDTSQRNVFFTSDTHFGHFNIMKYCNRPFVSTEEMDNTIIDRWNSVVGKNDIVFHLGDFAFASVGRVKEIVSKLNGHIWLVVGNHDWKMLSQSLIDKVFDKVMYQAHISVDGQKILLNHYPMLCYGGSYRTKPTWQLYGHVHTSPVETNGADAERRYITMPTQYDVGVDNNEYAPVSFAQVKSIIEKQIANNV